MPGMARAEIIRAENVTKFKSCIVFGLDLTRSINDGVVSNSSESDNSTL